MDMEQLLPKMRDMIKAHNQDLKIKFICDNMILLSEESDIIKYDDANSCMYSLHRSNSQDNVSDCNFMIIPYSMVQYMEVNDSTRIIGKLSKAFNVDNTEVDKFVKENTTFEL